MTITKVTRVTESLNDSKSIALEYDNGIKFAFFEADKEMENLKEKWLAVEAWVTAGNTIIEITV
jgi:hypothetical protein